MLYKWLGFLLFGVAVYVASYHYNKRFLDWLKFQSIGTRDYIVQRLGQMFIEIPPHWVLLGQFLLSFGLGFVIFLLFLPNLFPGIPFAIFMTILGWKVPKPVVDYMYRRRVKKFVSQMIDGLGLMSNGLKSGLSVVQSLGLVAQEMPNPIQQELNLVLRENTLGVPLEEAFVNLSKRIDSDEVEMFVTSINILKETGGNLAETFDTIVLTMRERIKVENKISAMLAQGFLQGVVLLAIPPVLGFFFYQTDPEFMRPLFSTTLGWIIIMGVIGLEFLGFFLIMKIIKVEV